MQSSAVLLNELTAILGSGRFKTIIEHLRTHFASFRAAARQHHRLSRPASAVDKDTHHEQCWSVEDEQESLQCDELVAEIEQRVTQLENVLTRYNSSACDNKIGAELPTSAHHSITQYNGTLFSRPAASALFTVPSSTEACYDEQLADGSSRRVRGNSASSCLLTTTNGGEQQIPSNSCIVKWASLPHHALWEILKQLRWEKKASGAFRSVCKGWREAHDNMVPSMKLAVPSKPRLPYRLMTGFTGVNELDLSSLGSKMDIRLLRGLASISGLRSLNLSNQMMDSDGMGHVISAWAPSLTGLTYLSMAKSNVRDCQLASLAPFLPSLTHLDLNECTEITLSPNNYGRPFVASVKALTRLNLNSTKIGDEGIRTLAPLTALTHLQLDNTAVTEEGVISLAPLTSHLTHLALSGEECGDAELIAVCSLTALTRLEMLNNIGDGVLGFSEDGMRALASLTGLVHLEMGNAVSDEGLIAISSLTAISHLHLRNPCYRDEGIRALACLTALTRLDMGDDVTAQIGYDIYNMHLSDQGARALGSLVRLEHLDICGVEISDEGVRALSSLTALTFLHMGSSTVSEEGVKSLTSLTALTFLSLYDTVNMGDEGAKALAALTTLTELQLNNTEVGDEGAKALAALTALTELHLDFTEVGDEGAKALAALTALTSLHLDCTALGDEGVKSLAALTALTELHLVGIGVGDEGVKSLSAFSALKTLYVDEDKVSDEGIKTLVALTALTELHCV